ncbi:MAG: prepilin-type N-terminal cleavage/methylation domain-containing protein [Limisphaerales bacterium]
MRNTLLAIKHDAQSDLTVMNGQPSRQAFTLIELLVVIAIIAILAAILMPVLNQAEQRAKTIECTNNFKQLQLAYEMYMEDNNSFLPPNETPTEGLSVLTNSWVDGNAQSDVNTRNIQAGLLFQYNKQVKIYVCPADQKRVVASGFGQYDDFGHPLIPGTQVPQTRSCSINFGLGGYGPAWIAAGHPYQGGATVNGLMSIIKSTQIQTSGPGPAQTICFADEAPNSVDDGCFGLYNSTAIVSGPSPDSWWNLPTSAHDNGCIFGFCDGHVEYWKWHGGSVAADNRMPYSTGNWPADPATGPGSSDDLSRAAACQLQR